MGIIAILAVALVIKNNEIKEIFKKKKINIELINNDKISQDYFFKRISIKEGQSFWRFNPFKLKEDLENFNEIKDLAKDLIDTCNVSNGAGLAASQIGENKQILVIKPSAFGLENPESNEIHEDYLVVINPEIIPQGDSVKRWNEQCLSVPNIDAKIEENINIPVCLWDERLSSVGAFNLSSQLDINVSKREKKIDENAAAFILQGAIDFLNN